MQRTQWFSAQAEPPVNGGPDAMYESGCWGPWGNRTVRLTRKAEIRDYGRACR